MSNLKSIILGPKGSHTDIAYDMYATKCGISRSTKIYENSILKCISTLSRADNHIALLPIENSIHGTVAEVLDSIHHEDFIIETSFLFDIHHCVAKSPHSPDLSPVSKQPKNQAGLPH